MGGNISEPYIDYIFDNERCEGHLTKKDLVKIAKTCKED